MILGVIEEREIFSPEKWSNRPVVVVLETETSQMQKMRRQYSDSKDQQ